MNIVCAPAPRHFADAYALFCSHRDAPWSETLFKTSLYKPFSLVALNDSGLVGLIVLNNVLDEAEVEDICVNHAYRHQGIAKSLLQTAIISMQASGIKQLHLEVRESNHAAIQLYEGLDFERVGARKAYYTAYSAAEGSNVAESALLYKRYI